MPVTPKRLSHRFSCRTAPEDIIHLNNEIISPPERPGKGRIFIPKTQLQRCNYPQKGDDNHMPTAKKLPSGSWRCQVFSHYEYIPLPDGSIKKKHIYQSFTCGIKSDKRKRICENMATAWAIDKENQSSEYNKSLGDAMDEYIEKRPAVLSPSTIKELCMVFYPQSLECTARISL